MTHGHMRTQCKHGVVMAQCRCIATTKMVSLVECGPACKEFTHTAYTEIYIADTALLLFEFIDPVEGYEAGLKVISDRIHAYMTDSSLYAVSRVKQGVDSLARL